MKIAERFDKPAQAHRILLIQLGDIGDVVWSLPALQAVRDAYPEAMVSVLVREGNSPLLAAEASRPGTFEVRKGGNRLASRLRLSLKLVRDLRRERFDLVFDFRGDERGGYMAFVTGAPIRAALHFPLLSGLRNRLFTHLVAPTGEALTVGAADISLYILRAFGIEAVNAVPELRLSEGVRLRALKILAGEGVAAAAEGYAIGEKDSAGPRTNGWVTVNPFSRWSYKEWGLEKWVQIIDWIWHSFGLSIVVVGSLAERKRAEGLVRDCAGKVFNLAGRTTLAELAGMLQLSRLHIGVDSAAPHIAAAVGTPTVTLYGPSDWRYWAPPGERNRVVVPDMECAPCHQKGCEGSGTSLCLDTLEVAQVQAVLRDVLSV
ncbi:MAG: glycosyltransferase family 9 protein [Proteobacteria bacterium]|nr:glycosyltransferase family 9 protein [Pseudomonadota bacterium]